MKAKEKVLKKCEGSFHMQPKNNVHMIVAISGTIIGASRVSEDAAWHDAAVFIKANWKK